MIIKRFIIIYSIV